MLSKSHLAFSTTGQNRSHWKLGARWASQRSVDGTPTAGESSHGHVKERILELDSSAASARPTLYMGALLVRIGSVGAW